MNSYIENCLPNSISRNHHRYDQKNPQRRKEIDVSLITGGNGRYKYIY